MQIFILIYYFIWLLNCFQQFIIINILITLNNFICENLILTDEQLLIYTLANIEIMLQSCGKILSDYPPIPQADPSLIPDIQNRLIHDELNYDRQSLDEEHV